MTKEFSEELCAHIGRFIADRNPRVQIDSAKVEAARNALSDDDLDILRRAGFLKDDFESYYVIEQFLAALDLPPEADESYCRAVFKAARKFTRADLERDPYLSTVRVPTVRRGRYTLTTCAYERGEIFLYDVPDLTGEITVPKLGFCTERVAFPAVYEGRIPWMSVVPSEMNTMRADMERAHGRVLVLGAGLGYYPFVVSLSDRVEAVTIVEASPEIAYLFREYLLPQFPAKKKITLVEADAYRYLGTLQGGEYDFCYADIWENQIDGAEAYRRIKPFERKLTGTEFAYWIEDAIRWQIDKQNEEGRP